MNELKKKEQIAALQEQIARLEAAGKRRQQATAKAAVAAAPQSVAAVAAMHPEPARPAPSKKREASEEPLVTHRLRLLRKHVGPGRPSLATPLDRWNTVQEESPPLRAQRAQPSRPKKRASPEEGAAPIAKRFLPLRRSASKVRGCHSSLSYHTGPEFAAGPKRDSASRGRAGLRGVVWVDDLASLLSGRITRRRRSCR